MGDMADDVFDRAEAEQQRAWEIQPFYRSKTNKELKEIISNLLKEKFYREDSYTKMMKSIIQYETITEKQRGALITHLSIHAYDWECVLVDFDEEMNYDDEIHDDWGCRD